MGFRASGGWHAGMTMSQCTSDVCVAVEARRAIGDPQRIVMRATYTGYDGRPFCGASRVTQEYSERTHFSVNIRAGGTYVWTEVMDAAIPVFYVVINNQC